MATAINLEKQVSKIFEQYETDVSKITADVLKDVAKEAVKKLKSSSPKRTGNYAKGWTYSLEKGRVENSATVYGKKQTYPLAHLLENGHAKRGGGRVAGIPHISPVEEWAVQEAQNEIERRISNDAQ